MNLLISLLSILLIAVVVIGQDIGQQPQSDSPVEIISLDQETKDERWMTFKRTFGKKYANEQEEREKRNVFEENCLKINEHNENYNKGFMCMSSNGTTIRKRCAESTIDDAFANSVGLNQLSDLTHNEIADLYCGLRLPESSNTDNDDFHVGSSGGDHVDLTGVPKSFDWSKKLGYVNSVKNQMENNSSCKSCWAFSAVDSLESQYRIKTNKTVHLSQQNLVDCAYPQEKDTCTSGGWMGIAFDYTDKFGINKYKDYLYDGVHNKCRFNQSLSVLKTKGYKYVNNAKVEIPNEDALVKAIYTIGPISVAVGASPPLFGHKSDIFKNTACRASEKREFNHAMTAVGYGTTTEGEDYFILKNSWGTSWGENGYMRILRNKNLCGLGYYSVYPLLDLE